MLNGRVGWATARVLRPYSAAPALTERAGRATARVPTAPLRCPRPYNDGDSCARVEQLLRSPDCLVGLPPERYGATVERLRRIFLFFPRAAWSGMAPQAGGKEIWCNCGAVATYFF